MDKRPLGVISVFFIVGIVLGRFMPQSITLSHVFTVTLILITLTLTLSLKRERGYKAAHVFLFLSIISLGSLLGLLRNTIFCHSRESGNPERFNFNRLIDTRFHGYDGFNLFRNSPHRQTFL